MRFPTPALTLSGLLPVPLLLAGALLVADAPRPEPAPGTGSVTVTPANGSDPTVREPGSPGTVSFTVSHVATDLETRSFSLSCFGSNASCVSSPTPVTLGPGESTDVSVSFQTGSTAGGATISLAATADDGTGNSTGTWNLTVSSPPPPPPPPANTVGITPVSATDPTPHNEGSTVQVGFDVQNLSTDILNEITVSLECSASNATCISVSPALVTLGGGASTGVTVTVVAGVAGGASVSLSGSASDGSGSAAGTWNLTIQVPPPPPPQASVTPKGAALAVTAGDGGSVSFNATNTGQDTTTYALSASCSGVVTTCALLSSSSLFLTPGAGGSAEVSYQTNTPGSGQITLTASAGGQVLDAGWYTVTVQPAPVVAASVTPKGTAVQAPPTTSMMQAFQVTNTGDAGTTYTYAQICSGTGVSSCAVSPTSGFIAVGQAATVTITYQSQATGTSGEVRLRASAGGVALDDGWVNVTVTPGGAPLPPDPPPPVPGSSVRITPVNGIDPVVRDTNTTGQITFQVKNVDTDLLHTITVDLSCTGFNATCLSQSQNSVVVNPADSAAVTVTFQTTVTATAAVWLTGVTQDETGSATGVWTMTVQALGPQALAEPKGTARSVLVGATDTIPDFRVTNSGQNQATYTLTSACSGVLTGCALPGGSTVMLPAGAQANGLRVAYQAPTAGTGQVVLRVAAGGEILDSAWYNVTVDSAPPPPASAAVTPQGQAVQRGPNAPQVQEFQVTNTGAASSVFTFTPLCSGTGVTTGCSLSVASDTVAPGVTVPVSITYQTLAVGTMGEVRLRVAAGGVDLADGWITVSVVADRVTATVTPDGASFAKGASAAQTQLFTVTNTSATSRVFTVATACSDPGVLGCTLPAGPTLPSLDPGVSTSVTVAYQTAASGSGVVSLQALHLGALLDSGHVVITVGGGGPLPPPTPQPAAPVVSLQAVNPGDDRPRSECVTIALGDNAAAECGDLRIVHPLPGFRTMNTDRALTLIYNSAFANPRPSIPVQITVPAGSVVPATIQVTLASGGATLGTWNFPGASWSAGTHRIVRIHDSVTAFTATQLKAYDVTVRSLFAADTLMATAAIELPVVVRRSFEFGHGWWVTGIEQLIPVGTDRLWVGGDGSTRLYRMKTSTLWEDTTVTRVDTLRQTGVELWRQEIGGSKVFYDANGRHVRTVNRRGHTTTFRWRANGQLDTVYVPLPSGTLSLGYHIEAFGTFTRIIETGLTEPDTTEILFDFGRMRYIQTPDLRRTSFTYAPGNGSLIATRTDKNNAVRRFAYDSARKVIHTALSPSGVPGDSILVDLTPAESRGVPGTGGILATEQRTVVTGPRAGQITTFEVNRFGAPIRVTDALDSVTTITRDAEWPGRIARLKTPSGQILGATYDDRGRIKASTDSTWPDVSGQGFATTRFTYGALDQVSRIERPIGFIQRDIDLVTGNVKWEEDSRGLASRTTFSYGFPNNTLHTVTEPGNTITTISPEGVTGNDFWIMSPRGSQVLRTLNERGFVWQSRQQIDSAGSPTINWVWTTSTFDVLHRDSVVTILSGGDSVRVTTLRDPEGNITKVSRQFGPDQKNIGVMTTMWTYDLAGRQLTETAPDNKTETRSFDAAGNVESVITRLGGPPITMQYDLLNRLLTRQVPSLAYADTMAVPLAGNPFYDFPALTVPARTETFTWHPSGGVATANNNDAQVTRSYHPNGLLQSETLRIREVAGPAFAHTYVTSYEYDANTRRKTIILPSALIEASNDRIRFTWEDWGALKTVTNPQNHTVTWNYDALGRPQTIQYPGNLSLTLGYDGDDNVVSDSIFNLGTAFPRYGQSVLRNVRFQHDARGKVLRSTETGGFQESTTAAYSGLGYLTNFTMSQSGSILILAGTVPQASYSTTEGYTPDGLGNITARTRSSALVANGQSLNAGSGSGSATFQGGTGRLLAEGFGLINRNYVYDFAGNTTFFASTPINPTADGPLEGRRSLYAPDGQLRFADWRWTRRPADFSKTVFDEYRYDALGRRVLVWSQRDCAFGGAGPSNPQGPELAECKAGFVRRTLWDGAQELGEIQVPDNAAFFEADSFTTPLSKSDATEDPNPYYGRVIYTPGLVVDQPVTITRLDYTDFPFGATAAHRWPSFVLVPQWNQRGQPQFGTFGDGTAVKQLMLSTNPCSTSTDALSERCVKVFWPLAWSAYDQQNSPLFPVAWHGSLLEGKQDKTGTLYRRNRSYDPLAGRFTQEDPIGLAGGVNLYGFANGDPVNFADPFGLMPCDPPSEECQRTQFTQDEIAEIFAGVGERLEPAQNVLETIGDVELGFAPLGGIAARSRGLVSAGARVAGSVARTGQAVARSTLTSRAGRFLFGKSGLLNSNRFLRIGTNRNGGRLVLRVAGNLLRGRKLDLLDLGPL